MKFDKMRDQCDYVTELMKALSHPQRLMLLCYLSEGEKTVSDLHRLCDISQSQVSQFLNRLHREKLLEVRREGQFSYYSIADKNVTKLLMSMQKIFCERN